MNTLFSQSILLKGVLIGLAIAVPVGPMGVLCVRRTFTSGRVAGLWTGLASTTAHVVYGAIAGIGIHSLTHALVGLRPVFGILGGVYLGCLGLKTFRKCVQVHDSKPSSEKREVPSAFYFSSLPVAFTNPMTVLSFGALISNVELQLLTPQSIALLTTVIFTGSALWWSLLSWSVDLLRDRMNVSALRLVNQASGLMLLGYSLMCLGIAR